MILRGSDNVNHFHALYVENVRARPASHVPIRRWLPANRRTRTARDHNLQHPAHPASNGASVSSLANSPLLLVLPTSVLLGSPHPIPFDPAAGEKPSRTVLCGAEFPHSLEAASDAVARVGVGRDHRLSFQAVVAEEALRWRWEAHAPSRTTKEHHVVLLDAVDLRLQRRSFRSLVHVGDNSRW